jgi:hypothetical protein
MPFKHVNDSIIAFEPETGIVLDVNDYGGEIYGFSREEFIGRSRPIRKNRPARRRKCCA